MNGPTSTRAITIQVQSKRKHDSAKRARAGFMTGLPMFRHASVPSASTRYDKWITADDALQLFDDTITDFIGISFITDRETAGFKTCAIGGIVNAFNTGTYPIYQFDVVYAVIPEPKDILISDGEFTHKKNLYNKTRIFYEQVAILCTQDSIKSMFKDPPVRERTFRIGVAMSTVKADCDPDLHMFSILLDKPTPKP